MEKSNKKTILFLYYRECTSLPPFMAILDALCDDFSLKVICCETEDGQRHLDEHYKNKNVHFLCNIRQENDLSLKVRLQRKLHLRHEVSSKFKSEAEKLIDTTRYDLLWVIHEQTAFEFRHFLLGKKYIMSFYELNDHRRVFLNTIEPVVKGADEVFVPEYNRACILRTWLKLNVTPTVIPNKPLGHPRTRNIPNSYSSQLEGKKVILYQGYIVRSRNVDKVCEAVKDMPGYCVVLMGKGDDSYINELKSKYPQILHIPFIAPPEHLYVTSWAHIAIVKYDFVYLNAIFCAPNKTWEYTGFDIPVLCHDIPGLRYTIGQYKAGVCTDMDDTAAIKAAIEDIDINYTEYSNNAKVYYESYDIKKELFLIVSTYFNK